MSTNALSQLSGKSNMAQVEQPPSYQQKEFTEREKSNAPSLNHEKAQSNRSFGKIQERVGCPKIKSDPRIQEATTWSPVENTTYRHSSTLEDKRPMSLRGDHAKADSPEDTHLPPSPQSQPRFSWSQIADVKVTEKQRTPINSRMMGEHIKSHEMSTEEKRRVKRRLLGQFPGQDPLVLELVLLSNNYNEAATRTQLQKWEENVFNMEESKGFTAEQSFSTLPPDSESDRAPATQSHDALCVAQFRNTDSADNDQNVLRQKILMKSLLVTSRMGSSTGGWMSQLPGMTCCLRSYKSSTYRGTRTKVITQDATHQSVFRTEPQGPNPALPKGPNKSLLSQGSQQAAGPNVDNRQGPNPRNLGDRIQAVGPNHNLVQGSLGAKGDC